MGVGIEAVGLGFMIVLTDGQYTEADPLVAGQAVAVAGIVIYTITFSPGADQTGMQQLATIGNGRHYHADTPGDLDAAFQDLGGTLTVTVPLSQNALPKSHFVMGKTLFRSITLACEIE